MKLMNRSWAMVFVLLLPLAVACQDVEPIPEIPVEPVQPIEEVEVEVEPVTSDGIDNDNDGTIDEPGETIIDEPIVEEPLEQPAEVILEDDAALTDGIDNDNDGTIDEPDEAAAATP